MFPYVNSRGTPEQELALNLARQQLITHGGGFSMNDARRYVYVKNEDILAVPFENEPNLEIMQRLSKRCVQTGLGKQKMHDGGKRALEWITLKNGGDETFSKNLVHHMSKAKWCDTTESQLAAKKIRFTEQRRAASAIERHCKDKAHLAALAFKAFGNVSYQQHNQQRAVMYVTGLERGRRGA
jgi:hypothetical protein